MKPLKPITKPSHSQSSGSSGRLRVWLGRLTIPIIALVGACLVPLVVVDFSLHLLAVFLARVLVASLVLVAIHPVLQSAWHRVVGS